MISFIILKSRDCVENSLSVQIDGGEPHRYCGNGTFTVKATNAVLRLYAPSGATFLGEIQTNNRPENENPNKFDEYNCKCGWKNPVSNFYIFLKRFEIYYYILLL